MNLPERLTALPSFCFARRDITSGRAKPFRGDRWHGLLRGHQCEGA